MSAIDFLRKKGPAEAQHIAEALRRALEDVYAELVRAEGAGKARVVVHHGGGGYRWCEWEAMR